MRERLAVTRAKAVAGGFRIWRKHSDPRRLEMRRPQAHQHTLRHRLAALVETKKDDMRAILTELLGERQNILALALDQRAGADLFK